MFLARFLFITGFVFPCFRLYSQVATGVSSSAVIEFKPFGTNLAYGVQLDYTNNRIAAGISATYSSFSYNQYSYGYYNSSPSRYQDMQFTMYTLHVPVSFRFGKNRNWESGMVYSYMTTDANYTDIFTPYYSFRYVGKLDMHFAGIQLAYRHTTPKGFFFKPEFRFSARVATVEKPDFIQEEIYNAAFAPDGAESNYVLTYFTFRMCIGYTLFLN